MVGHDDERRHAKEGETSCGAFLVDMVKKKQFGRLSNSSRGDEKCAHRNIVALYMSTILSLKEDHVNSFIS